MIPSYKAIPRACWKKSLDEPLPEPHIHTFSRPPIVEALSLLPVAYRVSSYIAHEKKHNREPIFDLNGMMLEPPKPGPYAGVPLGGIGGGAIGIGFRGDYRRWSIYPGKYQHNTVYNNLFSIRIKRNNVIYSKVLSTLLDAKGHLPTRDWNWGIAPENVTYHAVFPRAWTVFTNPIPGITVTIIQTSPVLPHNYSDSSLPTGVFEVIVENTSADTIEECSVMYMVENNDGTVLQTRQYSDSYGHATFQQSAENNVRGVCMTHHRVTAATLVKSGDQEEVEPSVFCRKPRLVRTQDVLYVDQGSIALAAALPADDNNSSISTCEQILLRGKPSGRHLCNTCDDVWTQFHNIGNLNHLHNLPSEVDKASHSPKNCEVGAAVCVQKYTIPPHETVEFSFSLAWDNPIVRFGDGRAYARYYTRFVGVSGLNAADIAAYALSQANRWHEEIYKWQAPVNLNEKHPEYYRHMLFNELYFMVDGGTVWLDKEVPALANNNTIMMSPMYDTYSGIELKKLYDALSSPAQLHVDKMKAYDEAIAKCVGKSTDVGKFLYLEGHEYLMYNTYDVHFYASFALLMLWPQLELSLQREFVRAVSLTDSTMRQMMGEGQMSMRKVYGAVPHDMGSPSEDPFHRTNIYNFQDVSRWKDLGPKLILQLYRDFKYSKQPWFLVDVYDTALLVMDSMLQYDSGDTGMIYNEGVPDQTYDIWRATGVHAYCGGLWIAACFAMAEMAKELNQDDASAKYKTIALKAQSVYNVLWNGEYYNYDSSTSVHHNSIMADMMAGQWYARVCGLPPVVPPDRAYLCYRKIYSMNVKQFGNGLLMGAVNGMRPDGNIDESCLQSREVWTGTTYALAAGMLAEAAALSVTQDNETSDGMVSVDISDREQSELTNNERDELRRYAMRTAQGIHDAGWKRYGYWFATPEAWEKTGNYRSLGYMRPLSIWAMQYSLEMADKD